MTPMTDPTVIDEAPEIELCDEDIDVSSFGCIEFCEECSTFVSLGTCNHDEPEPGERTMESVRVPLIEEELRLRSTEALQSVLNKISFAPSCVNLDWQWEIEELFILDGSLRGWLVCTSFVRPDTLTGVVSRGRGRQEFIGTGTSESGAAKTCWLLAELIVRHELMEAYLYEVNGEKVRIFNPHNSVHDLSLPHFARIKK